MIPRFAPTSSSVRGRTPSRPNRSITTRRCRGWSFDECLEELGRTSAIGGLELGLVGARVRDQVGDARVSLSDRGVEADRVLHEVEQLLDALGSDADLEGDLVERGVAVELLPEKAAGLGDLSHLVGDVNGQADRPSLLRQRSGDRLLDPPGCVGRKLEAELVVELLDRPDQAEVALLDEIEKRDLGSCVVSRDRHDEPEVRLDEAALRHLVALVLQAGELALLRRGEQPAVPDLPDVELERIVRGRTGEIRPLSRLGIVRGDMGIVGRVEEVLGGVAFHGACIGREVAPLEG